ncbi:hypothetical protein NUACC21_27120 [Scytonema sp. NUACC21]
MDTLISISIGVALSAACGFRIFVPPLVMSIAAIYGHLPLSADFQCIGTYPALVAFAVATCIEIAAYYIPWIERGFGCHIDVEQNFADNRSKEADF